ncbi:MAG: DUF5916 domain-containing protein [Acidobacteria bacterium]|nr:DUF5916 domain-containing protein [Acidobacteriota bacterium]
MRTRVLIAATILLLLPCAARGAGAPSLRAAIAKTPPVIDGELSDEEWAGAAHFSSFVQFEPHRGNPAREKTEAYFFYDEGHLYFAVRCWDSVPESITARITQRDGELERDDSVLVVLDTFHDRRTAYVFMTNLLGTQREGRVSQNGRVEDSTWDASWQSAGARLPDGWSVEMAIPLSALRYPSGKDRTWGINLGRTCRRLLELSFWAGPLEKPFQISQYGELTGLNLGGRTRRPRIIPYLIGQVDQGDFSRGSGGVDVRYPISTEILANLTLNPDFATVEADQEEVNLTRFELELEEKRQFFLEGADQYRQRIPIFYSRRIADIQWGAKLLAKPGPWNFSLLTAQSKPFLASENSTEPKSANYSVVRLQRDILSSSTLALMVTNRGMEKENRGAVGLDTTLFFTERWRFTGQLARSHGPIPGGRWAFFLRPARDTATSHVHFRYTHLGESFADNANAMGFIPDDDRREMDSSAKKTLWFKKGRIERLSYDSNYNIYWSQRGVLRSWEVEESVEIELRNRWSFELDHIEEFKLFEKGFRNRRTGIDVGYNTREWQSVSVEYEFGRNFDSDLRLLSGRWRHKITPKLSLEYELSRLWLNPDPENDATFIHVVRGVHNFTRDLFVKVFFQTSSVINRKNIQSVFVYRYKPPFGTIQFAFQRGTAAFGEASEQGNTFFLKFAYVF